MTTSELREMFPSAPMGHLLRMRQLLDVELKPRPVAPASLAWLFPFRMVSGAPCNASLCVAGFSNTASSNTPRWYTR
jgi:hypothetical protein